MIVEVLFSCVVWSTKKARRVDEKTQAKSIARNLLNDHHTPQESTIL